MSIVESAKAYAASHHGTQRYGKGELSFPYTKHLGDVAAVVEEFLHLREGVGDGSHLIAAAWLHDTVEDTSVTFENVLEEFGRNIARIVFAVSNEPGKNRRERHERTYPKIRAAGRDALIVKLSDRIANVRHSVKHNHGMVMMYKREYKDFRAYLKIPGELKSMWAELDVLMRHLVEEK